MKLLSQILILFALNINIYSQCNDFEARTSNWQYVNTPTGASVPQALSPCNAYEPGYNSKNSLFVVDKSGSTLIYNNVDFVGDFSKYYGKCLCFDIKLKVNNAPVAPAITFVQGFNPNQKIVWGTNPEKAVRFTSSTNLPVNNMWKNICVSFDKCSNNYLPNNVDGSWSVLGGGDCNIFADVMSNVEGVLFTVDMSGWPGRELFNLDNICMKECRLGADPDPTSSSDQDLCCPPINYDDFLSMFDIAGDFQSHSISFTPTLAWREKMQAYTNWRHALNPCLESFSFNATLRKPVAGTSNTFNLASNTSIGGVWIAFKANDPNSNCYIGNDLSAIQNGVHTMNGTFPSNRWHRIHAAAWGNPGSCYGWDDGLCEPWNIGFNYKLKVVSNRDNVTGKLSKIATIKKNTK